jgi:hypothetical protein
LHLGPNGYEPPVPLEGVNVCVAGARAYPPQVRPFEDAGTPCAPPSTLGRKVVLEGVPAMAEVMMTAALDARLFFR